ncbi:MAG TPA: AzlD domain-containing protein [Papillibacter sp.]|jgi:branched-subunit amino acid transport protein|nr:AzlD domain-containing protein [Papillibacter sp.]
MNPYLVICGMAVVTLLPRLLPAALIDRLPMSPRVERFLRLIPYTAMTALIVPGVVKVDPEQPLAGIIGAAVAVVISLIRPKPIYAICGAVLSAMAVMALL